MSDTPDPSRTDSQTPLNRRSYLRGAATAALASVTAVGTVAAEGGHDSASEANGDAVVVDVGPGETHTVELGDGDVLENTIIDITAEGARYQIDARGSGWTIRNVGVRGVWDGHSKAEPLVASVPHPDATGRIENLYLGDGAHDDTYPGATGIYVANEHAGTLEIDRVNIQGYPDNAIYGSSPGDLPSHSSGQGGGGEVHITNSFAADCRAGGFRVGTAGSRVENCVAVGCDRNVWAFYDEIEVVDCDFSSAEIGDVGTGDQQWSADATVSLEGTRFETTAEHSGRVVGESDGKPERTTAEDVDGVPTSAEDAADA